MDLYLQLGYGMMDHCRQLIGSWGGGTVILSPRDLDPDQLPRFARQIRQIRGQLLLDTQLYNPRATHPGLTEHDYWPEAYDTDLLLMEEGLRGLLEKIRTANTAAGTVEYLLPGLYCRQVEPDWLAAHAAIVQQAAVSLPDKPCLATVCLASEVLRDEEQVEALLAITEDWPVAGYYVIGEHPRGAYLVNDPLWLTNFLNLCAGLKLQHRRVVVGYCSHQMLCCATAGVDAIASGSWLNVRSFTPTKFQAPDADQDGGVRVVRYYCPQALSEYVVAFLDMGHQAGILDQLRPPPALDGGYANALFTGGMPSTTTYSEGASFRHYLHCLAGQSAQARQPTFAETRDAQLALLDTAETLIQQFQQAGIRGQERNFAPILDVNRSALEALPVSRTLALDLEWADLPSPPPPSAGTGQLSLFDTEP